MTITLNDPIQKKTETRKANDNVKACSGPMFGLLSSTGNRVDIFSGKSFFVPDKKMRQRMYRRSA